MMVVGVIRVQHEIELSNSQCGEIGIGINQCSSKDIRVETQKPEVVLSANYAQRFRGFREPKKTSPIPSATSVALMGRGIEMIRLVSISTFWF